MVFCLERELLRLSYELDCEAVLVLFSNRSFGACVVGNCSCLLHENGIELTQLLLFLLKRGLDSFSFLNKLRSQTLLDLAFHLRSVLISFCPENLDLLKDGVSLILNCDNRIQIDIHIAVCYVLLYLIIS